MQLLLAWLVMSFATRTQARCLSKQFACSNGNCIPSQYQCDRYNHCGDNSDEIRCDCYAGEIHLTGIGSSVSQGNVELCIENHFYAVCGNVWNSKDAKVVCRQLGFNNSVASNSSMFGSATTAFLWTQVAGGCTGAESSLYSCPRLPSPVSCTVANPAAVSCSSLYCPITMFQCANGLCISTLYRCDGYNDCRDNTDEVQCQCTRGMVRLMGGATSAEGTVEACFRNDWRTVCDTLWSAADAKVVCTQLGYTDGSPLMGSYFGSGSGLFSVWSDVGGCIGNESNITACKFTISVSCNRFQLAGVSCYNTYSAAAVYAAIGGGVGGGVLLVLCLICCVCACAIYYHKRRGSRSKATLSQPQPPAPAPAQMQSGMMLQEPPMAAPAYYPQDPYYNPHQYPAPPSYAKPYSGAGAPEQYPQPYADPLSFPQHPTAPPQHCM